MASKRVSSVRSCFGPHQSVEAATCDGNPACPERPASTRVRVLCTELEEEASRPEKDSKTLSSDLIEYVQHMIREHGDNFKVSETPTPPPTPDCCLHRGSCIWTLPRLSRPWPATRRTTTRTRPNRSGGRWPSTSAATRSASTPSWSRWLAPGPRACRGGRKRSGNELWEEQTPPVPAPVLFVVFCDAIVEKKMFFFFKRVCFISPPHPQSGSLKL